MKRCKQKHGIFFGVVAILFIMVSSATASFVAEINEDESNENLGLEENDSVEESAFVDPDLLLTSEHLEDLYAALLYLNDPNYIELIEEIINEIENGDGSVDSQEMQEIIDDSDVDVTSVHGPSMITASKSDGILLGFRVLRPLSVIIPRAHALLIYWSIGGGAYSRWDLFSGDQPLERGAGFIIGFYGVLNTWNEWHAAPYYYFSINGFATLVLHTNDGGVVQESQSSELSQTYVEGSGESSSQQTVTTPSSSSTTNN